ncbi:MAG: hypothetical protein J6T51_03070 [Kiritimatiellae bacterium]|nr:hypothetical protein [Kiritimatiellia bacterium]
MGVFRQFLRHVRTAGVKRRGTVSTMSMGRARAFEAYDVGPDTYIVERGVGGRLGDHPSVLVVEKSALRRRAAGRVMTVTTGNHAVAAIPLLDGRFWRLSSLPRQKRGEAMMHAVLCANIVGDRLEVSQRDVPTDLLVRSDGWLVGGAGLSMADVVMTERIDATLDHYHRLGQEWRIKPLAWTGQEMRAVLAASRKRISSDLLYYHSTRGVHFLSFAEFRRVAGFAETAPERFVACMRELVSVYEGNECSFSRMQRYRGHHEIEFFGVRRGVAVERLVPEVEKLMEAITLGRIGQLGVIQRACEIVSLFESLLVRPELADPDSAAFTESLYLHLTGEVYAHAGEHHVPAFGDRRVAIPGATFANGRQTLHPGADDRTEVLLSNLRGLMSKDEIIEYVNVYELRNGGESAPPGAGSTREVVYKSNRSPLETSLVEKRLSRSARGYAAYILSRIGALRSLGIALSDFYLMLRRRPGSGRRPLDYYIRRRCEGESMESIPASYFRSSGDSSVEEREVVLGLATLMGDAAAQNMAMKKYDPVTQSPLYGVGKEIYEFEYDIMRERVTPKRVATCSIRGSFGWPRLDYTDENLDGIGNFYMGHFAHALKAYQRKHPDVPMAEMAERFFGGFEFRTHALCWQLSVMRDSFESFAPDMPPSYEFGRKWSFVMWALERQERRLAVLRHLFFGKVKVVEDEDVRADSK